MGTLTLYSTTGCHLCEQARAMLDSLRAREPTLRWEVVDIALDDILFERYGWHIPVLHREDGAELFWPFGAETLAAFVANSNGRTARHHSAAQFLPRSD